MYSKLVVPVSLAHTDHLDKALSVAADLAKLYNAEIIILGASSTTPTEVAHDPGEFAEKLTHFGAEQSEKFGVKFSTDAVMSKDIAVDLTKTLNSEIHRIGADLVIMASHVPGFKDYIFSSNSGYLAAHTDLSVFIVR